MIKKDTKASDMTARELIALQIYVARIRMHCITSEARNISVTEADNLIELLNETEPK